MIDHSKQPMFDSERIGSAKITIAGCSNLAAYLCLYMTGFGIRNLKLIDWEKGKEGEFLTNDCRRNRAEQLEEKILRINKEMNIKTRTNLDQLTLGKPDVLVELSNNREAQEFCKKYSKQNKIPLISGASDEDNGSLSTQNDHNLGEYHGRKQGTFTSGIIAAAALDEIRKIIMPVEDDNRLKDRIDFCLQKTNRFNAGNQFNMNWGEKPKLKTLIVGAGGIGTYVALNLTLMGFEEIDIMDGDKIESHNLNRQVFYHGMVGENKAEVLSQRLKEFSTATIKAMPYYLKDESQIRKDYDIIFSCVDNWEWRFRLSRYATKKKTKLINGAVTTFSGKAEFSSCLECKYDKNWLIREQKNKKASCNNLNGNVVMPNALIGALMASEAKATALHSYQPLEKKEIQYNSKNGDLRKFVTINDGPCSCRRTYGIR